MSGVAVLSEAGRQVLDAVGAEIDLSAIGSDRYEVTAGDDGGHRLFEFDWAIFNPKTGLVNLEVHDCDGGAAFVEMTPADVVRLYATIGAWLLDGCESRDQVLWFLNQIGVSVGSLALGGRTYATSYYLDDAAGATRPYFDWSSTSRSDAGPVVFFEVGDGAGGTAQPVMLHDEVATLFASLDVWVASCLAGAAS